jgi:hypothetical protein
LKTVVECYENGAYVYDAINKTLHINPADEFKIIKSNNVSSDYWKMIEKK